MDTPKLAIDYFCDHLISGMSPDTGNNVGDYTNELLSVIAKFYGQNDLLKEYRAEMNSYHESLFETDLMWEYGEPVEGTCRDIWDILNLEKLFTLKKVGQ